MRNRVVATWGRPRPHSIPEPMVTTRLPSARCSLAANATVPRTAEQWSSRDPQLHFVRFLSTPKSTTFEYIYRAVCRFIWSAVTSGNGGVGQ